MAAPTTAALDDEVDGHGDTTYQAAVVRAGAAELHAAVVELPERQREALLLRELRGLSYDEVAATMGVTPPAVETLLWRARKFVAERVRVVPDLALSWARDALARLGGPLDVATTGAMAAKGAATVVAALTATTAAVEVERNRGETLPSVGLARIDNSGSGSASSGQGRGRGRGRSGEIVSTADDSSGKGRGRGRGGSGDGDAREAEDRSGSNSGSG